MDIYKIIKKYWLRAVFGIFTVLSWFGNKAFKDKEGALELIAKIDAWIIDSAGYPGLFTIFFALFLGTSFIPWIRDVINKHYAIERLWKLRRKGVSHRNDHSKVSSEYDYSKWRDEYQQWFLDAKIEAKKVSIHLYQWLDTLNVMNSEKIPPFRSGYNNAQFIKDHQIMSEALNRIERYLVRELILIE